MKYSALISSVIFLYGIIVLPAFAIAATCDSQTPGAQAINDGSGGIAGFSCPDGTFTSSVTGQTVQGTPTQTTQAPYVAPANSTCPNGGTLVNGACNLGYTPLEPIPGITTGTDGSQLDFPHLLGNVYKIAIIIGALFSVLMLTLSGVRYMLSDIVTDKEKARKRIKACLYGLVLIAASWLILNTINPQLVTFSLNPGSATVGTPTSAVSTGASSNTSAVQSVPASSIQMPAGTTQTMDPIQFNSQSSNDTSVQSAEATFTRECQGSGGNPIFTAGSGANQTAMSCITTPGLGAF